MGDDNISPSVLGVGRHPELLVSLKDGIVRLEGAEERLVLLEILEPPDAGKKKTNSQVLVIKWRTEYCMHFHIWNT